MQQLEIDDGTARSDHDAAQPSGSLSVSGMAADANADQSSHHLPAPSVCELPNGYVGQTALYRHQIRGILRMVGSEAQLLGDAPGLGKTLQALYAGCDLIKGKEIHGILVVCLRRHVHVWLEEIETHEPRLLPFTQCLATKNKKDRAVQFHGKCVWIVNLEVLARAEQTRDDRTGRATKTGYKLHGPLSSRPVRTNETVHQIAQLLRSRKLLMVCDEAHNIANPSSRSAKITISLGALAARRVPITGTAIRERSWDLWAQAFFCDHGKTLGKSFSAYLERFAVMRQTRYGAKPVRGRNLSELGALIRPLIIRRTHDQCPDVPKKIVRFSSIVLEGAERKVVLKYHEALLAKVSSRDDDEEIEVSGPRADVSISRLMVDCMRSAAWPGLFDASIKTCTKYQWVLDAINEVAPSPVIVWCIHRDVCRAYADALTRDGYRVGRIDGDVLADDRVPILAQFKDMKLDALVATQDTLREGETLIACYRPVYVQRDYKVLNWTQSQFRCAGRIGQKNVVMIDVPVADISLDLHIGDTLASKMCESLEVIDGKKLPTKNMLTMRGLKSCLKDGPSEMTSHIKWWSRVERLASK